MRANICLIAGPEVITAAAAERLSVSPERSYRTWSREETERIVGETSAPGANVSAIARSRGLVRSQLFAWRSYHAARNGVRTALRQARHHRQDRPLATECLTFLIDAENNGPVRWEIHAPPLPRTHRPEEDPARHPSLRPGSARLCTSSVVTMPVPSRSNGPSPPTTSSTAIKPFCRNDT